MPPALSFVYCTEDDVRSLLSSLGVDVRLDDDDDGSVSVGEAAFLLKARTWATARVLFYLQPRYAAGDLASSWLVNEWATILACVFVCVRRCNPLPDSVRELAHGDGSETNRGAVGDMMDVRRGMAALDVGSRNVEWPAWANVRVDPRYRVRQARVQRSLSEPTPAQHTQAVDYPSEFGFENY